MAFFLQVIRGPFFKVAGAPSTFVMKVGGAVAPLPPTPTPMYIQAQTYIIAHEYKTNHSQNYGEKYRDCV